METKKVLLVDDIQFFLELGKNYLSKTACKVFAALNGKEALEVALKENPDLIFLDYEMPEMNGLDFLKAASEHNALNGKPVVIVSAFVDAALEEKLMQAGAVHILKKPFTEGAFLQVVDKFLGLDKRKKERFKIELPAFFGFEDKMEKGIILDLSESGLFIAADNVLKENTFFELKFLFPGGPKTLKTWCRVIWVNAGGGIKKAGYPAGMGCEFIGLTRDIMNEIKSFIERVGNGS